MVMAAAAAGAAVAVLSVGGGVIGTGTLETVASRLISRKKKAKSFG